MKNDYQAKKWALLSLLFGWSLMTMAEEVSITTLEVWTRSGQKIAYALSERPVATYSDNDLVLTTSEMVINYPLAELHKFTFGTDEASSVIAHSAPVGKVAQQNGTLILSGFQAGIQVAVYTIDGRLAFSGKTATNGTLELSLRQLFAGVYVVKTGSLTHKIVIR